MHTYTHTYTYMLPLYNVFMYGTPTLIVHSPLNRITKLILYYTWGITSLPNQYIGYIGNYTCTQYLYTIPVHNTCTQYLYTIPVHNTCTQYLYTIPVHNTCTQYLYTIPVLNTCTQYLYTIPVHNTCTQYLYTYFTNCN